MKQQEMFPELPKQRKEKLPRQRWYYLTRRRDTEMLVFEDGKPHWVENDPMRLVAALWSSAAVATSYKQRYGAHAVKLWPYTEAKSGLMIQREKRVLYKKLYE